MELRKGSAHTFCAHSNKISSQPVPEKITKSFCSGAPPTKKNPFTPFEQLGPKQLVSVKTKLYTHNY